MRGADKFLARPGRKKATATKLGMYATYSPRSSIHFLARCSNFCKPLKKKKIRRLSVQPGLRGSSDLRVGKKMATFQLFFQSREQVVVRMGPDPENRVGDQDIGSPGRPVSSGLQSCLSHLIYIVRPCLNYTCHAMPMPRPCRSPTMPF